MGTNIEKNFILLKSLLCFIEVAKKGQIKEAAREIHMKQSNLSNQILMLEDDLKVKLFDRTGRGVSLTRSGTHLFQIACSLGKTIAEIQNFAATTHQVSGNLRLWTSEGLGSSYIAACLPAFYAKFPNVQLSIISSLKDPLSLSEFDLGIVYHRPEFANAFVLYEGKLNFYLYASKSYLIDNGYPNDIEDLKQNHKLCLRADFQNLWPAWRSLFDEMKNVTVMTDSSNMLLNLVENGLGISFIPSCVAKDSENLVPVLEDKVRIEHPFWIICPFHLKDVPKVRALMEYVKETTAKL